MTGEGDRVTINMVPGIAPLPSHGPVTSDDKIALDSHPDRVKGRGSGGDGAASQPGRDRR